MGITVLKDVLIARGEIERYYGPRAPIDLWRALSTTRNTGIFELVERPTVLSNGRPRAADIRIVEVGGVRWVLVADRPRGISTFDMPGVPPGKHWEYYKIPAGTILPTGLAIVRDEYNERMGATHYTIAPEHDMPLQQFKMLLNQLALVLVRKVV